MVNRSEEAIKVLKKVRGDDFDVQCEVSEIEESILLENGGWKLLFNPSIRPALLVGIYFILNTIKLLKNY